MKFVVPAFAGMAPRFANHLLDDMQASRASNLKVTNGTLRGFRGFERVFGLLAPPGGSYYKVKKLYKPHSDEYQWWGHTNPAATILSNPLATDAYNRVYIADGVGPPVVTTYDNLLAGGTAYATLGIPAPQGAPGVGWPGGGTNPEPRAYVYVFRSAFGETGPPSLPNLNTIPLGIPVTITVPAPDSIGFNVTAIDIYRTATGGETSGDYYRVGTVIGGGTTFVDNMAVDQVPLQLPLTSDTYTPPPANLKGLCLHSSGAVVGFAGNQVCFSEPFLPHAWPDAYRYTVSNPIVALASISNGIVVLTTGFPTVIAGNHPASVSIINMTDIEPCIAPRSVVTTENMVLYASPNGLIQVNLQGLTRLTSNIFTSEEWADFIQPSIVAVKYTSWYVAMFGDNNGFALALPPYEPTSVVRLDRYLGITTLETDERNGDAIVVQKTVVSLFDKLSDRRLQTEWTSKEFIAPKPINLGAVQLLYNTATDDVRDKTVNDAMYAYNVERFALAPLDVLNLYAIGGAPRPQAYGIPSMPLPLLPDLIPPPIQQLGAASLYGGSARSTITNLWFTLMVDGRERYTKLVSDEKVHKLPSGFKGTKFKFILSGNAEVSRIVVAETARECRGA